MDNRQRKFIEELKTYTDMTNILHVAEDHKNSGYSQDVIAALKICMTNQEDLIDKLADVINYRMG